MECLVETAEDITKAYVTLHNYLRDADQFQPETERYIIPVLMDTKGVPGECAARETQDGMAVQEYFKKYFLTDEGRVTWQDAVIQ